MIAIGGMSGVRREPGETFGRFWPCTEGQHCDPRRHAWRRYRYAIIDIAGPFSVARVDESPHFDKAKHRSATTMSPLSRLEQSGSVPEKCRDESSRSRSDGMCTRLRVPGRHATFLSHPVWKSSSLEIREDGLESRDSEPWKLKRFSGSSQVGTIDGEAMAYVSVVTVTRRTGDATRGGPARLLTSGFRVSMQPCETSTTGAWPKPLSFRGLSAICFQTQ
jgi:hypothetical protein